MTDAADDPFAALGALPGVADAVAAAREAVDRVAAHRVLRRHAPVVAAESALRGARATAALEGVDVPLAELRSAAPTDPLLQGALRATGEVGALVSTWRRAPGQALARLHALAAADAVDPGALGRPASPVAARRLRALGALLAAPTDASAVVVAAVVHGEVASLPAFEQCSGIVARTASRLVLVTRGVDRKSLLAPEIGHLERRGEYEAALRAYADGDVGPWVRHCAAALTAAARDALAVCEALRRG